MRISQLIARVEDRAIAAAPHVQRAQRTVQRTVQQHTARAALSLGAGLVRLSAKVAPRTEAPVTND